MLCCLWSAWVVIIALSACTRWVVREADVPLLDTVPWLDCTLQIGDTVAYVNLTPTFDPRVEPDSPLYWYIWTELERTSQVFLYRNGALYCGPFLVDVGLLHITMPYCVLPEPLPIGPDTWTLEVQLDNGQVLLATQTAPDCVPVGEVQTFLSTVLGAWTEVQGNVEVTFEDPPGQDNFYLLYLSFWKEYPFDVRPFSNVRIQLTEKNVSLEGSIPVHEDHGPWLIDGRRFDGETVRLAFDFIAASKDHSPGAAYTWVRLVSLTREAWAWEKAWTLLNRTSSLGPFAEPVRLPMNVEGGLGKFHMQCETEKKEYW